MLKLSPVRILLLCCNCNYFDYMYKNIICHKQYAKKQSTNAQPDRWGGLGDANASCNICIVYFVLLLDLAEMEIHMASFTVAHPYRGHT